MCITSTFIGTLWPAIISFAALVGYFCCLQTGDLEGIEKYSKRTVKVIFGITILLEITMRILLTMMQSVSMLIICFLHM